MLTDRPPLTRSFVGPLTQKIAAFVVAHMRRMEETDIRAEARWEFLRRQMEHIAERGDDDTGAPP